MIKLNITSACMSQWIILLEQFKDIPDIVRSRKLKKNRSDRGQKYKQ